MDRHNQRLFVVLHLTPEFPPPFDLPGADMHNRSGSLMGHPHKRFRKRELQCSDFWDSSTLRSPNPLSNRDGTYGGGSSSGRRQRGSESRCLYHCRLAIGCHPWLLTPHVVQSVARRPE